MPSAAAMPQMSSLSPPTIWSASRTARREMLETLADFDDDLMTLLLEDQEPPADLILRDLRKTLGDQVVPVFMGVAEQDMGVRRLLEALAKEVPEPDGRRSWDLLPRACSGPGAEELLSAACRQAVPRPHLARLGQDGTTLGDMRVGGVYRLFGGQQQNVGRRTPARSWR